MVALRGVSVVVVGTEVEGVVVDVGINLGYFDEVDYVVLG